MAYDEGLAERIRQHIGNKPGMVEKKMFGGIGFILNGNMACGVNKNHLVVRVGPEAYGNAVIQPHTRPFDITGRPMKGWVMVDSAGLNEDKALLHWVEQGVTFAASLPAK